MRADTPQINENYKYSTFREGTFARQGHEGEEGKKYGSNESCQHPPWYFWKDFAKQKRNRSCHLADHSFSHHQIMKERPTGESLLMRLDARRSKKFCATKICCCQKPMIWTLIWLLDILLRLFLEGIEATIHLVIKVEKLWDSQSMLGNLRQTIKKWKSGAMRISVRRIKKGAVTECLTV